MAESTSKYDHWFRDPASRTPSAPSAPWVCLLQVIEYMLQCNEAEDEGVALEVNLQ